jgi:hypothetical protein
MREQAENEMRRWVYAAMVLCLAFLAAALFALR